MAFRLQHLPVLAQEALMWPKFWQLSCKHVGRFGFSEMCSSDQGGPGFRIYGLGYPIPRLQLSRQGSMCENQAPDRPSLYLHLCLSAGGWASCWLAVRMQYTCCQLGHDWRASQELALAAGESITLLLDVLRC